MASRRVVQAGALLMICLGVLSKIGGLFVTIPDPIIGGVFMVMFGKFHWYIKSNKAPKVQLPQFCNCVFQKQYHIASS